MKGQHFFRDKNVIATFAISIVIITLFIASSLQSADIIRERSFHRMEEGVNTVVAEVVAKFNKDSRILNAAADIIASAEVFDDASILDAMENIRPLLETMDICVLMPDNRILQPKGSIVDGALDYATEAALGEHVSNRVVSVADGRTKVLRHFVPVQKDGETVALVYGRTRLEELSKIMNIDNIYNASADVYIIDAGTGDLIMDTKHDELGNIDDYNVAEVRGSTSWETVKNNILHLRAGYVVFKTEDTGTWQNFYYSPAGINRWEIAVSVPEKEALSSMYAIRRVYYVTGAMMLVAIGLYYYWTRLNAKEDMKKAVERAVLEEKLQKAEAAQKAKTTFLSNMSHDIRTPMNAIIGFAALAKNNIEDSEKVGEYLEKIGSSSSYLLSLINDILDMSRIESGKLNIEEKPCSISEIFRDMRNIIQTQMQSKQLAFFMDTIDVVDEDILCDKLHINQVLLNLLSNSIKFTEPGGSVFLTIQQKPTAPTGYGAYEIRVKDTGIGMNAEFVEHIFEPFERERTSTVSGIQGTGLGMAITKNIVDAMDGTIEVKTEEGKGTEFIINLNFRLQADHMEIETSEKLAGLHALVVDDNFSTCDSVSKMLTQLGMRVEWSMHGREAVLRARQAKEMDDEFFAYIIDWALPDLNGEEVVRQIRAEVGEQAMIIIMTAYDWASFEKEGREAGVTAFCNKPVFLSELRELLENNQDTQVAEAPAVESEPVPQIQHSDKRLLIVEDNELNREIVEELMQESGFMVESVEDGSLAVERMKEVDPDWYDLILMDVQMPIMNGHEATKAIRKLEDKAKANIPIVAMTANAFEEDRLHALECGMNDYVSKPIDVEVLLGIIDDILSKRDAGKM